MQTLIDSRSFIGFVPDLGIDEKDVHQSTPLKDFFRGKCVLLTGGTGFIGRLLIEKMLRVGVREIYLIARPKKDKSAQQRMQELCKGPIFDRLRRLDPDFINRITPIDGDLIHRNLGIFRADQERIISNVDIVIHAAADVRFDETLKVSVEVNIRATRDLLEMALKMSKLEVFVYLSTAYSNCPRSEIYEKFYEPPYNPYKMMELVEAIDKGELNEETIITLTSKIITPWPNTYSFTKAICEDLVKDYGEKLPMSIVRPSIVIATNEDPFPGWTDNIYGLNGILTACALGLLRALHLRREYVGDVIPADFVSNAVLAAAWDVAKSKSIHVLKGNPERPKTICEDPFRTKIYNCTTSADNPITWGMVNDDMRQMYEIYPPKRGLWYNSFNYTRSGFLYRLMVIFYHVLPGLGFDLVFMLTRQKFRLMPVYRKVHKFTDALSFFTTNEWLFHNDNMKKLCSSLSPEDAEYFPCDVRRMVWGDYIHHYGKGLRMFIGKENINTLPEGRKRRIRMKILHNGIKLTFYALLILTLYYLLQALNIIDPITFS